MGNKVRFCSLDMNMYCLSSNLSKRRHKLLQCSDFICHLDLGCLQLVVQSIILAHSENFFAILITQLNEQLNVIRRWTEFSLLAAPEETKLWSSHAWTSLIVSVNSHQVSSFFLQLSQYFSHVLYSVSKTRTLPFSRRKIIGVDHTKTIRREV